VVLEVSNKDNRQLLWGPSAAKLRGRWEAGNLGGGDTSEAGLRRMPVVPGIRIIIRPGERTVGTHDPLSEENNRTILAEINNIHKALFKNTVIATEDYWKRDASDDEIATWLYWAHRAVSSGNAVVIAGTLPQGEEGIKEALPDAKIKKKFFDSIADTATQAVRESLMAAGTMG
jgi:hypothetical protein